MRTKILVLVLVLSLTGLGFGNAHQKVIDRTTASVVRITGEKPMMTWAGPMLSTYTCSGFVIDIARVLTAAHCAGENMLADGNPATVLVIDTFNDLALVASPTTKPALSFRDKNVKRGEAVTAIGFGFSFTVVTPVEALVMLVDYQIPDGELNKNYPPMHFYQGVFASGMSGGPVVDSSGRVVGMVQASGEGVGLGVGTLAVRTFLLGLL